MYEKTLFHLQITMTFNCFHPVPTHDTETQADPKKYATPIALWLCESFGIQNNINQYSNGVSATIHSTKTNCLHHVECSFPSQSTGQKNQVKWLAEIVAVGTGMRLLIVSMSANRVRLLIEGQAIDINTTKGKIAGSRQQTIYVAADKPHKNQQK